MAEIKKQATQKEEDKAVELDIFPLEDNVEMPNSRDTSFEDKTKRTLDVIKIGQSFVVPKSKYWKVRKISKEDKYISMKLVGANILPEKTSVRIKRLA